MASCTDDTSFPPAAAENQEVFVSDVVSVFRCGVQYCNTEISDDFSGKAYTYVCDVSLRKPSLKLVLPIHFSSLSPFMRVAPRIIEYVYRRQSDDILH